jgi:hypothetical protein
MSLDPINKGLFSSDPLAKLSRVELVALESKITHDLNTAIEENAAQMRGFEESIQVMRPLIDQQVAVRLEIRKRDARLMRDRRGFWVVLFIGSLALVSGTLWLLSILLKA